jgi:hypothetical protein
MENESDVDFRDFYESLGKNVYYNVLYQRLLRYFDLDKGTFIII